MFWTKLRRHNYSLICPPLFTNMIFLEFRFQRPLCFYSVLWPLARQGGGNFNTWYRKYFNYKYSQHLLITFTVYKLEPEPVGGFLKLEIELCVKIKHTFLSRMSSVCRFYSLDVDPWKYFSRKYFISGKYFVIPSTFEYEILQHSLSTGSVLDPFCLRQW